MIRPLILAALIAAAAASAAFRLHTETTVMHERKAIGRLDREAANLRAEIDRLSFEVEVLESAPRLNELSADRLPLAPGSARQMADEEVLREVLDPAQRLEAGQ
jgi:hypothetical protein